MILSRPWISLFLAGCCCTVMATAQEGAGSGTSGSSGTGNGGAGGASGTGSTPGAGSGASSFGSSFGSESSSSGASSSFGSVFSSPPEPSSGASSFLDVFGTGGGAPRTDGGGTATSLSNRIPDQAPPSFSLSGFYGEGSTTLFGGAGRLGRPDFEMGLSFSIGYDDNIFQTPTDTPEVVPGIPFFDGGSEGGEPIFVFKTVSVGGGPVQVIRVQVGSLPPEDAKLVEPLVDNPNKKQGSILTRSNLTLEMLKYTRRSLFTLDFSGGRTYYWDKDEEPVDYNGSLSATYLYRFTPRLQMTARANSAYLSQPDLSRPNTPERQVQGDIINTLGRLDASYRFTPRISLTGTLSYAGNRYTEKTEETGNYDTWTLGLEGRYLWQPRWTLLGELRYAKIAYPTQPTLDATTTYALIGTEFVFNRRISGSLRTGSSIKQFKAGDEAQIAPYLESTVTYRSSSRSSIQWTNRFGFEEAGTPDDERLVYRSTIAYSYAFTPRLSGSASVNLVHEITTNKVAESEFTQDTFDSSLGLNYQWTRKFSLNANYSFTIVNSNTGAADYYRNRIFFGGQYTF